MNEIFKTSSELGRRSFMSQVAKTAFGVGVGMPFINPAMAAALPNTDPVLERLCCTRCSARTVAAPT